VAWIAAVILAGCSSGVAVSTSAPASTTAPTNSAAPSSATAPTTPTAPPTTTAPTTSTPPTSTVDDITVGSNCRKPTPAFTAENGSGRIDFRRRCEHKAGSYFIDIEYPTLSGLGKPDVVARMNDTVTKRLDQRVRDLQSFMAEADLSSPRHLEGGLVTISVEVLAFFDDVISLHTALRWYGGGAVGDTLHEPFNFDPRTGNDVPFLALFERPDDQLGGRVTDAVRTELQHRGIYESARFGGSEPGIDFSVPDNYARYSLSEKGVTVYFRRYQIGPGSTGSPSVDIPYSTWEAFFAPDSLATLARGHFW
jgi:hypothetical protein